MSLVYVAFILCALDKIGVEAAFRVYLDDVSIEEIDSEYFDVDGTNAFINDNTITSNLTLVKELPIDSEAHFKLNGLSMGKYTLPTGVDILMPLCEVEDEPIILGPFFEGLGILGKGCPPPAGNYFNEGYNLPMENMPDDFPNNKYMVVFEITYNDEALLSAEVYADIQS